MKKLINIVLTSLMFLSVDALAQDSIIENVNPEMLKKYIQAAKDYYPRRKIAQNQENIAKTDVTLANVSYLDIFNASYFYRPNNQTAIVNPGVVNNPYIVNGVQYGININLGSFLSKPFAVKKAKSLYKVAQLQAQDYDITLETEVKRRYYAYVQSAAELKVRTQTAQDNKSVTDVLRRKFEKGETILETYNMSRLHLADSNTSKIQAEVDYLNAKDALEEIIGTKISEIK